MPGLSGACVYQARALYSTIYNQCFQVSNGCGNSARVAEKIETETFRISTSRFSNFNIFPNPSSGKLTISSKDPEAILKITISDLSGRILIAKDFKSTDFLTILDINLINGAYLVTLINNQNEKSTKKLFISK